MKISELSEETLAKIRSYRWDRIIEKHEGPWRWSDTLDYHDVDFLTIGGHDVLLPLDREHHPNITILRHFLSEDRHYLTVFLKDTTYGADWHDSGYMGICESVPGENFYLATLYHEWFIIDEVEAQG